MSEIFFQVLWNCGSTPTLLTEPNVTKIHKAISCSYIKYIKIDANALCFFPGNTETSACSPVTFSLPSDVSSKWLWCPPVSGLLETSRPVWRAWRALCPEAKHISQWSCQVSAAREPSLREEHLPSPMILITGSIIGSDAASASSSARWPTMSMESFLSSENSVSSTPRNIQLRVNFSPLLTCQSLQVAGATINVPACSQMHLPWITQSAQNTWSSFLHLPSYYKQVRFKVLNKYKIDLSWTYGIQLQTTYAQLLFLLIMFPIVNGLLFFFW